MNLHSTLPVQSAKQTSTTAAEQGQSKPKKTPIKIETVFPIMLVEGRAERTYSWYSWERDHMGRRVMKVEEQEVDFARGRIVCARDSSPCELELEQGRSQFAVLGDVLNSPTVSIPVADTPIYIRTEREKSPVAGGIGFLLIGIGALLGVAGGIGTARGLAGVESEDLSASDLVTNGLVMLGFGTGMAVGGYILTLRFEPGKFTVGPWER